MIRREWKTQGFSEKFTLRCLKIISNSYPNVYILKDIFMDENDSDGVNEIGAGVSRTRDNLLFPTWKVQHSILADVLKPLMIEWSYHSKS